MKAYLRAYCRFEQDDWVHGSQWQNLHTTIHGKQAQ